MGLLCRSALVLALAACYGAGCGGGSSTLGPSIAPVADFSLTLSSNILTVAQGTTSSSISVGVTPQNGFGGTVQVTLTGFPSGVVASPASPFPVAAGASTTVLFNAAANSQTGSFTISVQGSSGASTHSVNLMLTIQPGAVSALPSTAFLRTDSLAALDNPGGEPHHRHLVFDGARKQLFVANRAMNRIEVIEPSTFTRTGQIVVAGASSTDLSADGGTLWVGSTTSQAVAVDPQSLQVKASFTIRGLEPLPNTTFDRPEELLAMSSGNLMVRLRQAAGPESLLAMWNPPSDAITNLTSAEPQLFQNGLGAMARSGDHAKLFVAASDASGEVAVFDGSGNVISGPRGLGAGSIPLVATNNDGTRFAVALGASGGTQLMLLDANLNSVSAPVSLQVASMAFAADGSALYVTLLAPAVPGVMVLDGHDLHLLGEVPDAATQGVGSILEESGGPGIVYGLGNRGVAAIDATIPIALASPAPVLAAAPTVLPAEGPNTGGTVTTLSGDNFGGLSQFSFGAQSAESTSLIGSTQIQATSPPNPANGAVNLTAYFSNGWLALAPDAFSYGPQILQVLPNAGRQSGVESIQILGYGFGSDPSKVMVTIGGSTATAQKVDNGADLGLPGNYPFSLERVTLTTPAVSTAGKADITLNAPSGYTIAPAAFQFLQSDQFFAKAGLYKFILYDQKRQRLYLSNIDHVDVFDLVGQQFLAPLEPPGGPPPAAGLRGLALTPDGSKLVVADFGSQNLYLIDPDKSTGSTVAVGGVPGLTNSGPSLVAATSVQTVFVGLSGQGAGDGCSSCLAQINLSTSPPVVQSAPQPEVSAITGAPILQSSASGDHIFVAFGTAPGAPIASWAAMSPNQFSTVAANAAASDLATAGDGTSFALQTSTATEIRKSDLTLSGVPTAVELAQIPGRVVVPGLALHPSGALLYQPFLTRPAGVTGSHGGVDIFDAHSGTLRLRVILAQQLLTDVDALHGSFLAIDETGTRLFMLTSSDGTPQNAGVTVIQLASVPLAIGTVSPGSGPSAGGTSVTVRGSGFRSGTTAKLGGATVAVVFVDANTITFTTPVLSAGPQRLTLTNSDGESVSLDAAFTAN